MGKKLDLGKNAGFGIGGKCWIWDGEKRDLGREKKFGFGIGDKVDLGWEINWIWDRGTGFGIGKKSWI